jgi:hypothetical protein
MTTMLSRSALQVARQLFTLVATRLWIFCHKFAMSKTAQTAVRKVLQPLRRRRLNGNQRAAGRRLVAWAVLCTIVLVAQSDLLPRASPFVDMCEPSGISRRYCNPGLATSRGRSRCTLRHREECVCFGGGRSVCWGGMLSCRRTPPAQ